MSLYGYYQASKDHEFVKLQIPRLQDMIVAYLSGTRYGLRVDQTDGLITGGQPEVQLTWMDAKVGDLVVIPASQ